MSMKLRFLPSRRCHDWEALSSLTVPIVYCYVLQDTPRKLGVPARERKFYYDVKHVDSLHDTLYKFLTDHEYVKCKTTTNQRGFITFTLAPSTEDESSKLPVSYMSIAMFASMDVNDWFAEHHMFFDVKCIGRCYQLLHLVDVTNSFLDVEVCRLPYTHDYCSLLEALEHTLAGYAKQFGITPFLEEAEVTIFKKDIPKIPSVPKPPVKSLPIYEVARVDDVDIPLWLDDSSTEKNKYNLLVSSVSEEE